MQARLMCQLGHQNTGVRIQKTEFRRQNSEYRKLLLPLPEFCLLYSRLLVSREDGNERRDGQPQQSLQEEEKESPESQFLCPAL